MMTGVSRTEYVRRLQSVTDAALAHLQLEDLLDALLIRTRQLLDVDTCAILLLDDETNELVARAALGIEEEVEQGVRIPVGRGFAGRIAAQRRPIFIPDVDEKVQMTDYQLNYQDKDIRSQIIGTGDHQSCLGSKPANRSRRNHCWMSYRNG